MNKIRIFSYKIKNADNAKREKDGKTNFGATGYTEKRVIPNTAKNPNNTIPEAQKTRYNKIA